MLLIVSLFLLLRTSTAVFFHEKSSIVLAPAGESNDISFGYSLGYQGGENASLVIGAPLYDETGRVYQRSVQDILRGGTTCDPLDIDLAALNITYDRTLSPDQQFYLGASIAATENFFVTCAPLRTAYGAYFDREGHKTKDVFGAYGACFTYDRSRHAHACQGYGLEQTLQNKISMGVYEYGSSGWSVMTDQAKDTMVISKSFNTPDLFYSTLDPGHKYRTLSSNSSLALEKDKFTSFGKAMAFGNYFDTEANKTFYAFSLRYMSGKGAIAFYHSDGTWKPLKSPDSPGRHKLIKPYRIEDKHVGSMFGFSLASADVTGDGAAELFVGAPAQVSDGRSADRGAVHVYSKAKSDKQEMELKLVIWGVKDNARFGTTLATNDVDGDSYPEIFVSAPFEMSGVGALYIMCGHEVKHVKETKILVSELKRTQVIKEETHKIFGFSLQPVSDFNDNGSDELIVKNVLSGNGAFNDSEDAIYEIDLASNEHSLEVGSRKEYCRNITIVDASFCIVNTTVSTMERIEDHKEFNETWVTLSTLSELTRSNRFECVCPKPGCAPVLNAELRWSGSNYNTGVPDYLIGSSKFETVEVSIHNTGTKGCKSCALIRVRDLDHQLQCQRERDGQYLCPLESFVGNTTKTIEIQLVMDTLSNQESNFTVDVEVRQDCEEPGSVTSLTVPYDFTEVFHHVIINGTSLDREIADTEIQDESEEIIFHEQTYTIFNNQSFMWKNTLVNLTAKNKPYIQNFRVAIKQTEKYAEYNGAEDFLWGCVLNLAPYSITKISISTNILKKELARYLQTGNITIPSELVLELLPDKTKNKMLTSVLTFKTEMTFWHNKPLIIMISLLAALLALIIITVILYKLNFFRRKNKEKQEIRRRSIRRESSRRHAPPADDETQAQTTDTVDLSVVKEEPCEPTHPTNRRQDRTSCESNLNSAPTDNATSGALAQ
ncbi:uncharacterized protein LOC125227762 isoform X2 [Leguminivora glycinivorella]|uniref:uncharacterized protein LOC125227762 isoform X2 n=1 Tax=Leguminivora glycinivorella TaxID=1035111 RepID=UPI00200DB166|nr:uncharacterized protein LOC125227762 isoform X2 [Leguminivora glycinivorella]